MVIPLAEEAVFNSIDPFPNHEGTIVGVHGILFVVLIIVEEGVNDVLNGRW